MLVRAIVPFITERGAVNPHDEFELDDKLAVAYLNDDLVVPVITAVKETAIAPAGK